MPTIKELAAYAGVSTSTVSIILRGRARNRSISPETEQKVLNLAKELGYQPNITARRLRDKQTGNRFSIAMFWAADFRAYMMMRFLRGLQQAIKVDRNGCELILHPYTSGRLCDEAELLKFDYFHAAIICNTAKADLDFLENKHPDIPVVLYNRHSDSYCTVNMDDICIGQRPAEIFAARGHRLAAILASKDSVSGMGVRYGTDIRTASFLKRCQELSLPALEPILVDSGIRGGYEGMRALLAVNPRPDCLFCASDDIAMGALRVFAETGLHVPEDMELIAVGNGDPERSEFCYPSLSVMQLPMEEMAGHCYEIVKGLVRGNIVSKTSIQLPVEYVQRESCGK